MKVITKEYLREHFSYNEFDGLLYRKKLHGHCRNGFVKVGDIAGYISNDGYYQMCIFSKKYKMHRIIWFYFHNEFPNGNLDHIDGNKLNNKITNLRIASNSVNMQNQFKPKRNNKTGFIGVRIGYKGKFVAEITINKRKKYIGCFDSAADAHSAYLKVKKEFHPSAFFGKEDDL